MIGIVVVTHGRLGEEMVRTLEGVMGPVAKIEAVSTVESDPEVVKAKLRRVIERSDDGEGALILTDMSIAANARYPLQVGSGNRTSMRFALGEGEYIGIRTAAERLRDE